eukprot:596664-Hanusia_phi.AAC.2
MTRSASSLLLIPLGFSHVLSCSSLPKFTTVAFSHFHASPSAPPLPPSPSHPNLFTAQPITETDDNVSRSHSSALELCLGRDRGVCEERDRRLAFPRASCW